MKKINFRKSLLSFLLILAILFPSSVFADNLHIGINSKDKDVEIEVSSYPDDNISITIEDSNQHKDYIDQGRTDKTGIIKFKTKLDYDNYSITVKSSDGNLEIKRFIVKNIIDPTEPTDPENKNKASLYVNGYNGTILNTTYEDVVAGESALDFTKRVLNQKGISIIESNGYVSSIGGQAEFDKGKESGWMFKINGEFPKVGATSITVKPGDSLDWLYTYDMGKDIGNSFGEEGKTKENEKIKDLLIKAKDKTLVKSDLETLEKELEKSTNINDIKNSLEILKNMDNKNQNLLTKAMDLNNTIIDRLKTIDTKDILREARINLDIYFYLIDSLNDKTNIKNLESIVNKTIEIEKEYDKGKLTLLDEVYNNKNISKEIFNRLIDNKIEKLDLKLKDIDFETNLNFLNEKINEDIIFSYENNTINIKTKSGKILDNFYTPIKISLKNSELKNREFTVKLNDKSIGGLYNSESKRLNIFLNESGKIDIIKNIKQFDDIGKVSWAGESIETMAAKEIVKGISDNKFNPNGNITRAEFAALTSRMLNLNISSENKFKDIKDNDWYKEDVLKILEKGYINGKSENTFDPNGNITREEISKIIGEIVKDNNIQVKNGDLDKFKDSNKISSWAREGAKISSELGIIKGANDNFSPKSNGTRAEVVTMIYRLYEILLIK